LTVWSVRGTISSLLAIAAKASMIQGTVVSTDGSHAWTASMSSCGAIGVESDASSRKARTPAYRQKRKLLQKPITW